MAPHHRRSHQVALAGQGMAGVPASQIISENELHIMLLHSVKPIVLSVVDWTSFSFSETTQLSNLTHRKLQTDFTCTPPPPQF